jgi:hypothetical protein
MRNGERQQDEPPIDHPSSSSPAIEQYRDAAHRAAELTFDAFPDEPESDYYQAPDRSPEQTWTEIRERIGIATGEAVVAASDDAVITPELVCSSPSFAWAQLSSPFPNIVSSSTISVRR